MKTKEQYFLFCNGLLKVTICFFMMVFFCDNVVKAQVNVTLLMQLKEIRNLLQQDFPIQFF